MIEYIYVVSATHNPNYTGEHPLSFKAGDKAVFTQSYIVRVHKLRIESVTVNDLDIVFDTSQGMTYAFCDFNKTVFLDEESANDRARELWKDLQPDEWPDFRINNKDVPWWYVCPPKSFWSAGEEYPVTGVDERFGNYYIYSGKSVTQNPEFESESFAKAPRKRPPSSVVYYRLVDAGIVHEEGKYIPLNCAFDGRPLGVLKEKGIPFDFGGRRYIFAMKQKRTWIVTDYETGLLVLKTRANSFEKAKAIFLDEWKYIEKLTNKHDRNIEEIWEIMYNHVPTIRKYVDSHRQS